MRNVRALFLAVVAGAMVGVAAVSESALPGREARFPILFRVEQVFSPPPRVFSRRFFPYRAPSMMGRRSARQTAAQA
jgi:hypothetical protein